MEHAQTAAAEARAPSWPGPTWSARGCPASSPCKADFTDAVMKDCKLVRANLKQATLHGANLSGADLSGADLAGADLPDAILVGAKTFAWNVSARQHDAAR